MSFKIIRKTFGLYGVFGEMYDSKDSLLFVTLEHSYLCGASWLPKVAPGTYTCKRRRSPRFGYDVFEVVDVPNFKGQPVEFIEIHILNFNNQSEGCIGVGMKLGDKCILESGPAFNKFMGLLDGVDSFPLTIE